MIATFYILNSIPSVLLNVVFVYSTVVKCFKAGYFSLIVYLTQGSPSNIYRKPFLPEAEGNRARTSPCTFNQQPLSHRLCKIALHTPHHTVLNFPLKAALLPLLYHLLYIFCNCFWCELCVEESKTIHLADFLWHNKHLLNPNWNIFHIKHRPTCWWQVHLTYCNVYLWYFIILYTIILCRQISFGLSYI